MKKILISDHFTMGKILLFSLPTIGMQLVDNTYQVADGYFISNYIGPTAFAAESVIFPPLAVVAGVGLMFGAGGAAVLSQTLGEGNKEKANRQLSMITLALAVLSLILGVVLYILMPKIAAWVGAPEELIPHCVEYGRILAACMPFQILNAAFHPILITADKATLGFIVSIINAAINILLDWVAVGLLHMGLTGAALATGLAWVISAMIPLIYFFRKENPLHFGKIQWSWRDLGQTCYNGASEMADSISYAVVAIFFNARLLEYIGEFGVDAYAVSEYVSALFISVFFGISMSITPVVGYHLGNKNSGELQFVFRNGSRLMGIIGLVTWALSFGFAWQIAGFFVGYDPKLSELSVTALRIISFSFLLYGVTVFVSAFFTGLGDGKSSLIVALNKCLIMPMLGLLILPNLFGSTGIWLVTPFSELLALAVVVIILYLYHRKSKGTPGRGWAPIPDTEE